MTATTNNFQPMIELPWHRRGIGVVLSLMVTAGSTTMSIGCTTTTDDGRNEPDGVGEINFVTTSGDGDGDNDTSALVFDSKIGNETTNDPLANIDSELLENSKCLDEDGYEFSTIWIANSMEGTVSKINTQTGTEVARYRTGGAVADPTEDGANPSRTSVNLRGDVAVSNRSGTIIKIIEKPENCRNFGEDDFQTSQGPKDILDWADDDCVMWVNEADVEPTDFPYNTGGPRATAWDAGVGDGSADVVSDCYGEPDVWVGWAYDDTDANIRRIDGHTGKTVVDIPLSDYQQRWGQGVYGGAVDINNDFWAMGTVGTLIRVDSKTHDYERWDHPDWQVDNENGQGIGVYGLALAQDGTPWMSSWDGGLYKFDLTSETFVDIGSPTGGPPVLRGLAIDGTGTAWIAGHGSVYEDGVCSLVKFDIASETYLDGAINLDDCLRPVGVSIDSDSFVWIVDQSKELAYKMDPETKETTTVTGLVGPYTYSDMTGAGLGLVQEPIL